MPPCCLFPKHAPGHNRTHTYCTGTQAYNDTTRTQTNEAEHTHIEMCCTCFYSPRMAHFLWFSHFSLFSRQPTSHVAGSSCVLCRCWCRCQWWWWWWCTARRTAGSVRTSYDFCMAGCPNRSGLLFSSLSLLLLDFHFCFASNTFLATVRLAAAVLAIFVVDVVVVVVG